MPRSNRPKNARREEPEELDVALIKIGFKRTEFKRGVEYEVQPTNGSSAEGDKTWVCPHCNLQISKGMNHTVAWDAHRGVDTRRHFHNSCWKSFQGGLF